ncbi:hypothetical protein ACPF7I_06410 [Anoxybacillus sp. D401a]|uniref:hypothetical protein n=1 Tax=Anoxybacillus sp. D401a TaxID=575112 RepID=UPI003D337547
MYRLTTVDLQLKQIMRDLKHHDPQKRYEALCALEQLSEEEIELQPAFIRKMIAYAAETFPDPVDEWDDPSYHVLQFALYFVSAQFVPNVLEHFACFSSAAKEMAFCYVCELGDEQYDEALYHIVHSELQQQTFSIPWEQLRHRLNVIKKLIDHDYAYLPSDLFCWLLLHLHREGVACHLQQDEIVSILIRQYRQTKEMYAPYDADYSPMFVFRFWKENYLSIRADMHVCLSLMEFYFNEEIATLLQEALSFRDPTIQARAIVTALQHRLTVADDVLLACANNIESASLLYEEMERIGKKQLFPMEANKLNHFAKSHLFYVLTHEYGVVPNDIEMINHIEMENEYNEKVRYYFLAYVDEQEKYVAWVGVYVQSQDGRSMFEYTYVPFIPLQQYSIEEHKKYFIEQIKQEQQTEHTLFRQQWTFRWTNILSYTVLMLFICSRWLVAVEEKSVFLYVLSFLLTALGIVFVVNDWRKRNREIVLTTKKLMYADRWDIREIPLNQIKRVTFEKRKNRYHIFHRKSEHIVIYNERHEQLAFPKDDINEEQFVLLLRHATNHLQPPPHIQK